MPGFVQTPLYRVVSVCFGGLEWLWVACSVSLWIRLVLEGVSEK